MQHIRLYLIVLLTGLLVSSCFKKEQAVAPYQGTVAIITNNVGYFQSYYDFENDTVMASNAIGDWELGFECGKNGWHILVNSGNGWFVWNSRMTDINATITLPAAGFNTWRYDQPSYTFDSTAVGDWVDVNTQPFSYTHDVYFLGKSSGSNYLNQKRIVFDRVDSSSYYFHYRDVDTGVQDTVVIDKKSDVNFVYYSFEEGKEKLLEPPKTSYDLIFGPYYDIADALGVVSPYLVRGAFLNPYMVEARIDTTHNFETFGYSQINFDAFTARRNVIGYDWKVPQINVNSNSASYSIVPGRFYIVKTVEGNYYKMKFINYTLNGKDGYPWFIAERLN